jgi:hypothetical protein
VNERTCPIHPRQVKQHWKSEMRLKKDRTGHAMGRPRRESSVVGDPGAKFFWETRGRAQKQETRNKKETEATDVSQTAIHLTKARFLSAEPSPPQTVRSRVQWPVLTRPQMAGFEVTTEERILQEYPALHSFDDPVSPRIEGLLRKPFPAQTIAIMGVAKRWQQARTAMVVAECGTGKT